MKKPEQIERKLRRIGKLLNRLNDPKHYGEKEMTQGEIRKLYEVIGQWEALNWVRGK